MVIILFNAGIGISMTATLKVAMLKRSGCTIVALAYPL